MGTAVKASIILAVLVAILSVVTIGARLHENVPMGALLFIAGAMILNVGVVYWALRQTADECTYGQQIKNALVIGAIGGVLVFGFSILNVSTIFPSSLEETRVAQIAAVEASADPDEIKQARIDRISAVTPVSQAIPGFIGTFVTSLLGGAIVAVFQRKE